jgi:hypothetical protein
MGHVALSEYKNYLTSSSLDAHIKLTTYHRSVSRPIICHIISAPLDIQSLTCVWQSYINT